MPMAAEQEVHRRDEFTRKFIVYVTAEEEVDPREECQGIKAKMAAELVGVSPDKVSPSEHERTSATNHEGWEVPSKAPVRRRAGLGGRVDGREESASARWS